MDALALALAAPLAAAAASAGWLPWRAEGAAPEARSMLLRRAEVLAVPTFSDLDPTLVNAPPSPMVEVLMCPQPFSQATGAAAGLLSQAARGRSRCRGGGPAQEALG